MLGCLKNIFKTWTYKHNMAVIYLLMSFFLM
jgi:hypothetical protein